MKNRLNNTSTNFNFSFKKSQLKKQRFEYPLNLFLPYPADFSHFLDFVDMIFATFIPNSSQRTFNFLSKDAGPNTKNSHDSETMCRLKLAKAFLNTVQELCDLAAVGLVLSSNLKSEEMTKNELNFANQIKNSVSKIKVSFEGVFKWLIDKLNDMNEKVKMKIKNNAQVSLVLVFITILIFLNP